MRSLNFPLNMFFLTLENVGGITSFMTFYSQTHLESFLDLNFVIGLVLRNTIGWEEKEQHPGENGRSGLVTEGMEASAMACS